MSRLYVGNLPLDICEADIRELFEKVGTVSDCTLIVDKFTNKSRGFAFVEMASKDDATKAIAEYNGKDYKGRQLAVLTVYKGRCGRDIRHYRTDNGPGVNRGGDLYTDLVGGLAHREGISGMQYFIPGGACYPARPVMPLYFVPERGRDTGNTPGLAYPDACSENPAPRGGGHSGHAVTRIEEGCLYYRVAAVVEGGDPTLRATLPGCYRLGVNPLPRVRELYPHKKVGFVRRWAELFDTPAGEYYSAGAGYVVIHD